MKITNYQVYGVLKNYTRKLKRRRRKEDAVAYDLGSSHLESRRHSIVRKITAEILQQIARSSQRLQKSVQAAEKPASSMLEQSTFAYQTIDEQKGKSVRVFSINSDKEPDRPTPSEPETSA